MIRRSLRYAEELTDAVKQQLALAYSAKDLLAFGLRSRLREGYTGKDFAYINAEEAQIVAAWFAGLAAELRKSEEVDFAST